MEFLRKKFFSSISDNDRRLFNLLLKVLCGFFHNWIPHIHRNFLGKHKFFEKIVFSSNFLDIEWETFGLLLETSTSPWEQFEDIKKVWDNFTYFYQFLAMNEKNLGFFMKMLRQGCQNRNMRLETTLYRKSAFCWKIFLQSFGQGAGKLRNSCKIFRGKFFKTEFDVSSRIVLEKYIIFPEFFFPSAYFERKFFGSLATFF